MQLTDANIRSSSYYIAQTTVQCMSCGQWTRVVALALSAPHEDLDRRRMAVRRRQRVCI